MPACCRRGPPAVDGARLLLAGQAASPNRAPEWTGGRTRICDGRRQGARVGSAAWRTGPRRAPAGVFLCATAFSPSRNALSAPQPLPSRSKRSPFRVASNYSSSQRRVCSAAPSESLRREPAAPSESRRRRRSPSESRRRRRAATARTAAPHGPAGAARRRPPRAGSPGRVVTSASDSAASAGTHRRHQPGRRPGLVGPARPGGGSLPVKRVGPRISGSSWPAP